MNEFMMFAQATEGDFTVGQEKLNQVAQVLAYDWVYMRVYPDTISARYVCNKLGFSYDQLLSEEIDYLERKTEEEISKYGAT